ncbi:MAG: hypothetical protein WBF13_02210 [Candidatus Zixiibacteriota bacterium]
MKQNESILREFPEHRFVDTAFGGVQNRNKIADVYELKLPSDPVDCFASIFRFKDDFKTHVETTGSVRGADSFECYADYLLFDIDDTESLERALDRTKKLIRHLELNYDLSLNHIRVWFSGSKGFHVGVPSVILGITPSTYLPRIMRGIAFDLADGMGIDTSIYEKNRLFRMENSIHSKTGLYKIPVSVNQLFSFSIDEIKGIADDPRQIVLLPTSEMSINPALKAIREKAEEKTRRKNETTVHGDNIEKKCIERLLEGVREGERNQAACRIVDYYKERGVPKEIAKSIILSWNDSNEPRTDEAGLQATVESIFEGDYDYGCKDSLLKKYCDTECKFHPKQRSKGRLKKQKDDVQRIPVSFCRLEDGSLVEMLYDSERKPKTFFAKYQEGRIDYVNEIEIDDDLVMIPFSRNQIVETRTILFPSKAEPYEDHQVLMKEIQGFVHKYLGISEFYEKLVCYYVPFTWIYDCFNVLPYLRALGDWGSGKSRFLQVIGSICYKPVFCSGAATTSPIFRLIEKFKGTIVVDEGDFRDSDEAARLVKIFNQGYMKGFPVIINEPIGNKYEPRSYDVYGPKILATRNEFKDKALESRCITEVMDGSVRDDIPLILPDSFWEEALAIRNKLLMWRFKKWGPNKVDLSLTDRTIEPRLAQVTLPLLSVITDPRDKAEFQKFVRDFNRKTIQDRGESLEADVLAAVCQLFDETTEQDNLTMKAVADRINEDREAEEQGITPRKVGYVVGKRLRLDKIDRRQGHCIARTEKNREILKRLKAKYGMDDEEAAPTHLQSPQRSQCPPVTAKSLSLIDKGL